MNSFTPEYWDERYSNEQTGWDIGYISTPLKEYFDQLTDKNMKILVPGAGNGHEVEYLFGKGFKRTYLLDFSLKSIQNFKKRNPNVPDKNLIQENFFHHSGQYDLIIEQTFFSAISPSMRVEYAKKCYDLLENQGKMAGLLFGHQFDFEGPPFGGSREEYENIFSPFFSVDVLETAHNSIAPRQGSELFIKLTKKPK